MGSPRTQACVSGFYVMHGMLERGSHPSSLILSAVLCFVLYVKVWAHKTHNPRTPKGGRVPHARKHQKGG